jgi:predicted HicB family RNase H-like nuclease
MATLKRRLSLHMPLDLADWVEKQAKREHRSINNFVIKILEEKRSDEKRS